MVDFGALGGNENNENLGLVWTLEVKVERDSWSNAFDAKWSNYILILYITKYILSWIILILFCSKYSKFIFYVYLFYFKVILFFYELLNNIYY